MPRLNILRDGHPVPPRGGPVLGRALRAAFNRVPGLHGRYAVALVGDEGALLSERLASGTHGPLMLVQPGALLFPSPDGLYTAFRDPGTDLHGSPSVPELRAGWPFKRVAAILAELADGPAPDIIWSERRLIGNVAMQRIMSGSVLGQPISLGVRPASGCAMALRLNPEFAGTFCGNGTPGRDRLRRLHQSASYLDERYSAIREGEPSRAAAHWRSALAVGRARVAGSPEGVLEDIGTVPRYWNAGSDPGGEGDDAGSGRGDDSDDWDGSDDEDQLPQARDLPRPRVIADPELRGVRFSDWERGSETLAGPRMVQEQERQEARARALEQARNSLRLDRVRLARELAGLNADEPGCDHCRNGACEDCTNSGGCMNCGARLPLAPTWQAIVSDQLSDLDI